MYSGEIEFLEGYEVDLLPNSEPTAKRKRYNPNKKWTVAEEKALLEFVMEHRSFERPTAQSYYKRFAEGEKINVDWKVTRSKFRNMRTIYNKAMTWEGSTGAGSMDGETMKATLMKKCNFFKEFDELFGARLSDNIVIDDTLDESMSSDVFNSTQIDETTTSSVGYESGPSTSRRGIYSRSGVSDIMDLHTEMMDFKKKKCEKDLAFKDMEIEIKQQELALRRKEIELKQKEIESKARVQILELQMKERVAMEELKLKYTINTSGN